MRLLKLVEASRVVAVVTVCLVGLAQHLALAQRDPLIGAWQLNPAKSTFSPGPPPRSQTLIYSEQGLALKATNRGIDAQGKRSTLEFTIAYDEKDYPTLGSRDYDLSAYRRIDAHTSEFTRKKGGKVVQRGTRVLSKDGNTLIFTVKGVDASGRKISNVVVFEREER